jgi:thiol peroxidase
MESFKERRRRLLEITFAGSFMTIGGTQLSVGDKLPDFIVAANDLSPVTAADTSGIRVFLTVPSLDTSVCDLEVRTFNKKAADLSGVTIYAVSEDLPFAQARWCAAAGIKAVKTLSDYKDHSFGNATGTFIEALGLLTRAVFIVDSEGTVLYAEYVKEITNSPDYEAAYAKLSQIV